MNRNQFLTEFIDKIWNNKEMDSIPTYVGKEYTIYLDNEDPWEGKTLNHEEFCKRLNNSFLPFPDMNFEVLSSVEDGNCVAIQWIMRGTNTGALGDILPTNRKIEAKGFTIYHFRDNKICEHTQVYDRTTIMRQLGFT